MQRRHSQTCRSPVQVALVLQALRGHVAQMASQANASQVIQCCLQSYPPARCTAFYQEVIKSCVDVSALSSPNPQMSMHRHGCCVVQCFFTTAPPPYRQQLTDVIAQSSRVIIPSPFGNYVIQVHVQ